MEETKPEAPVEAKPEPKKKTKKEIEEEKRQKEEEARLAAEQAARDAEREGLIEKLEKAAEKEAFRLQQKWRRDVTDKVKAFALPEQQVRANIQAEYERTMKDVKSEYEQALKELEVERDRSYKESTKVRDNALETLRVKNKEKYDAMEAKLEGLAQEGAKCFEGFKNKLNSATLDELRVIAKKRVDLTNDAPRTAEART